MRVLSPAAGTTAKFMLHLQGRFAGFPITRLTENCCATGCPDSDSGC
jgi:hypothetical protein